jgi:molybdenum cofactor cytidylyltransferase
MKLHEVFRLSEPCRVAVVGAGGKTSTIWRLAESLTGKVVVTTTTHLGVDQVARADKCIYISSDGELLEIDWGNLPRATSITGRVVDGQRLAGLTPAQIQKLLARAAELDISVLVEADGARGLPLKAPAAHEPVIPAGMDAVIVAAGLSGLGQPLDETNVFRAERFGELSGIPRGEIVTPEAAAGVLIHAEGGLKGIPDGTRRVLFLNQLDMLADRSQAMRIANLCKKTYDTVIIGSAGYQNSEPHAAARVEKVACIILAAGGSSRFHGKPKARLVFDGQPLVVRAIQTGRAADMDEIVVVSGHGAEELAQVLKGDSQVRLAHNPDWQQGQATSIKAGLRELAANPAGRSNAVIFMLVDQPFVTPDLLRKLIETHQTGLAPIAAPIVGDARANPVLFDRVTFAELMGLQGDTGGRAIMGHFPHTWLPWLDDRILLDIDTPEDLERCQRELR